MGSGILLRREIRQERAVGLQRMGNSIRRKALTVRSAADAAEVERINNEKQYQVKGRVTVSGRYVYDVFRILNNGTLELCGSDFPFFQEAAYFVADLLAGKTRVAMAGIGNVNLGRSSGGLLVPTQPRPGPRQKVAVTKMPDGSTVFKK